MTKTCPYCSQVREQLEWDGREYVEYDVEGDGTARARLVELVGPNAMVPVLVDEGRVAQVGVAGRGCYVGTDKESKRCAVRLLITGVVQGVGFRPFVYRLARQHGIAGWVLNGEDGVHVVAEASDEAIARFVGAVRDVRRPPRTWHPLTSPPSRSPASMHL